MSPTPKSELWDMLDRSVLEDDVTMAEIDSLCRFRYPHKLQPIVSPDRRRLILKNRNKALAFLHDLNDTKYTLTFLGRMFSMNHTTVYLAIGNYYFRRGISNKHSKSYVRKRITSLQRNRRTVQMSDMAKVANTMQVLNLRAALNQMEVKHEV